MNIIDIVLLVFLLLGLVRGFIRGLFVELASLIALIAGIYGAIHFSNYAAELLESQVDWEPKYIAVAAFAITFLVIVLVITLAGRALTKLANFAMLGIVNKILGALFGVIKSAFILSVILVVLEKINTSASFISQETREESALYYPIHSVAPMVFPILLDVADEIEELELEDEKA